jgi:hypothetical protein
MGRPRLFNTPEEMQGLIDEFFIKASHPTITGLALHLGFESRQSFYDYQKEEGFSYTIKRARSRIENAYEAMLYRSEGQVTGAIFALKNVGGWTDKQVIESTNTQRVIMTDNDGEQINPENTDL